MKLQFTGEVVQSPDGISCSVLDVTSVDFSNATQGRKSSETLVRRAEGGEAIETKNGTGQVESVYTAQAGDAIFINLHNPEDIYVPGNPDGTRWQFGELNKKGYEIVGDDAENGGVRVKSTTLFRVLPDAIQQPTCIKDCFGKGAHAFFQPGAALKLNANGQITGIDKGAFDNTWEIVGSPNSPGQSPTMRLG